ncbi:MAG: transposase [Thermoplasmatales archaeon]|nr:transposase [Thermoplasmatales archaeon]
MNGLFLYHTNQSNLNRFVIKSNWDPIEMNRIKIEMINSVEKEGVVVIDDYIVEKYGKEIYGVGWHYDHCNKRKVWGSQIADCVLSGNGIYPLLSSVYVKKGSKWGKNSFKTKIKIQMEHLTQLVEMRLNFSCVVMDSWYFCKKLIHHIKRLEKDWVAECKSNKLVISCGKWVSLNEFTKDIINKVQFRIVKIDNDVYQMKALTVHMKGIGRVRLLISLNKHGNFNFYATNRLDWKEVAIASRYARRWDTEVWHREGKGNYGIEDCQLRSDVAVSRYLTLNSLAANLLEIASMLSPVYATLVKQGWTPEIKHRWILIELVFATDFFNLKNR